MDPTRRQFGLWSSAALLCAPIAARAGKQAKVPPAPEGLDAVRFVVAVKERTANELTLAVTAINDGAKGVTLTPAVASFELSDGAESRLALGWINDNTPFSRRVQPPSFVDLAPKRQMLAFEAHLTGWNEQATDALLVSLSLVVRSDGDQQKTITLAPFPVTTEPGTVLTEQQAAAPGT